MTAPLPPYQPSSPAWQAGYEHAKRQAVEECERQTTGDAPKVRLFVRARTAQECAAAILTMRPPPPRVSPGMEPTPYSAPTRLWNGPVDAQGRPAPIESSSALCGQPRGNEGVGG